MASQHVEDGAKFVLEPTAKGNHKDQCLVANAAFYEGELILIDKPIVGTTFPGTTVMSVAEAEWLFNDLPRIDQEDLKAMRVDSIAETAYRKAQGLSSEMPREMRCEIVCRAHVRAMFATYAIKLSEYDFALYKVVSRINHSCDPNAVLSYNPEARKFSLRALRDIEANEEITVSRLEDAYDLLGDKEQRHAVLGFKCACNKCKEDDDATLIHERYVARTEIRVLESVMNDITESIMTGFYHGKIPKGDPLEQLRDETFAMFNHLVYMLVKADIRGYALMKWFLYASEFALRTDKFTAYGLEYARMLMEEMRSVEGEDSKGYWMAKKNYRDRWHIDWYAAYPQSTTYSSSEAPPFPPRRRPKR